MLATEPFTDISSSSDAVVYSENGSNHSLKRRRRPAGTPDPDAEVVSLSPETLMESDHYVCEICNQGFQREQNLQMHRRRHKIPWKLLKGEAKEHRQRVYVCPELTCLHHDPCHALGDLVGIKKHFRRKHSNHKQWVCHKCSKGYAVQSDYKAHLKTCGTRGHSCDCGRVFSRVDTFMEHQDICKATTMTNYTELKPTTPVSVLQTLRPVPHNTENLCRSDATWNFTTLWQKVPESAYSRGSNQAMMSYFNHNMEVEPVPFPSSNSVPSGINLPFCANSEEYYATQLKLSVGSSSLSPIQEQEPNNPSSKDDQSGKANFKARICVEDQEPSSSSSVMVSGLIEDAREQLQIAMHEKALAEQKRQQAKWQVQLAEEEFKRANQIRQQALAELNKAQVFKDLATKDNNSKILQITCHSCKKQFQKLENGDNSSGQSYISSVIIITGREKEKDLINHWENLL